MPAFERVCPECGTSNALGQAYCAKCRAPLMQQTEPPPRPQSPLSRRGMALLTWRVTKFLARTGFGLARASAARGIERMQNRNKEDVKNETIEGEYSMTPNDTDTADARTTLRGWRVYSDKPEAAADQKTERLSWGSKKSR